MSKPTEETPEATPEKSLLQTTTTSGIKLDEVSIATLAELYPEEVREPLKWLAAYLRNHCANNLHLLIRRLNGLNFHPDYTYFWKIFSGRYFSVEGKKVGSTKNFIEIVDALKRRHRNARTAGKIPFIETTIWELINDYIDDRRAPDRICKIGAIVGWTGSQKSACFREYALRDEKQDTIHIESPERPRMSQLVNDMANAFGFFKDTTQEKKINYIINALNENKVIIIDNVQNFYNADAGARQPLFNFLIKIQEEKDPAIILSYTPDSDFNSVITGGSVRGYFEQFIGRIGGLRKILRLPNYPPREDVLKIAEAFGLRDAPKHSDYLEEICREPGRIRILCDDLQAAKKIAIATSRQLTIGLLRMVRREKVTQLDEEEQ